MTYSHESHASYRGDIVELLDFQVFVFGSNPVGINGNPEKGTGGAALVASSNRWCGQREKIDNRLSDCGKSYGIVTVTYPGKKLSLTEEQIMENISKFYRLAFDDGSKRFLVAYSGKQRFKRSLNGYTADDMARMFAHAHTHIPFNVIFEENFAKLVQQHGTSTGLF